MQSCITRGLNTEGILPGPLRVPRRAPALHRMLTASQKLSNDPMDIVDLINMFALAVNEENAAGCRVVTAPTNDACGIIPARNAIASVKAINAARMALRRTSEHRISLDKVIETMYETGKDMNAKYRETSRGSLAIKVQCD